MSLGLKGVIQGVICDYKTEDYVHIMVDQLIHHFDHQSCHSCINLVSFLSKIHGKQVKAIQTIYMAQYGTYCKSSLLHTWSCYMYACQLVTQGNFDSQIMGIRQILMQYVFAFSKLICFYSQSCQYAEKYMYM